MADPRFAVVPLQDAFDSITTQHAPAVDFAGVASTTAAMTPLEIYMHLGTRQSLDFVLTSPPSVSEVVFYALSRPGVTAQDRAIELLGRLSGQTLSVAIQGWGARDYMMRPIYADKAWEILASALSQSNDTYQGHIVQFFKKMRSDSNPVKRLAAMDALETLEP